MIWRIRDRATFLALRRSGRRARRGPVSVTFLPAEAGPPRVAFAIGRRTGGAVERNRLRRRLRAITAERAPGLPPGAYLVVAGPEAAALSYPELALLVADVLETATR